MLIVQELKHKDNSSLDLHPSNVNKVIQSLLLKSECSSAPNLLSRHPIYFTSKLSVPYQ